MNRKTCFFIIITFLMLQTHLIHANTKKQKTTQYFQIIDSESLIPLIGAHVWIKGENIDFMTITDNSGFFCFKAIDESISAKVSYIGYKTTTFNVSPIDSNQVLHLNPQPISFPEIDISASRHQVSINEITLLTTTMSHQPNPFDDAFRSLHALPGITANGYDGTFYVRGGLQNELLVELDGHRIDRPFHFEQFPFGPINSFISYRYLSKMDLSLGGFSCAYGDKMSGLLKMHSFNPEDSDCYLLQNQNIGGGFGADIISSQGILHGIVNLKKYGKVKWVLTGRRGHLDNVFKLTDSEFNYDVSYGDLFAKVIWDISESENLGFYSLVGTDKLKERRFESYSAPDSLHPLPSGAFQLKLPPELSKYTSRYYWLKYEKMFSSGLWMKSVISFDEHPKEYSTNQDYYSAALNRNCSIAGLSSNIAYRLSGRHFLKFGWELHKYNADGNGESTRYIYPRRYDLLLNETLIEANPVDTVKKEYKKSKFLVDGWRSCLFLSDRIEILPTLTSEIGIRLDYISLTEKVRVNPRLIFTWKADVRTEIRGAIGFYDQSPDITDFNFSDGELQLFLSRKSLDCDKSIHYILNVTHHFLDGFSARIEMYHKNYTRLSNQSFISEMPIPGFLYGIPCKGRADGFELFSRFHLLEGKLTGWTSYSLARTNLYLKEIIIPVENIDVKEKGGWADRSFDQRHTITTVINYSWMKEWNLGIQLIAHSGRPYSELEIDPTYTLRSVNDSFTIPKITARFDGANKVRYPAHVQLDIKFRRSFDSKIGMFDVYIGMLNILNQPNYDEISGYYEIDENSETIKIYKSYSPGISVTPFVGLFWKF